MGKFFVRHSIDTANEVSSWKHLLKNYSLEKIDQEIQNYRSCCHTNLAVNSRIESVVNSLLNIDYQGSIFFPHFKYNIELRNNRPYYFFRIRKLSDENKLIFDDKEILLAILSNIIEFKTLTDVWERPSCLVDTYQRLNKPHESVLYTSLMTSTAVLETRLKEEDIFALIIYKLKSNANYSDCSRFVYINELSEEENMKRYLLFNFLREEFTRILPNSYSEGNQYCAAYHISQKFFIDEGVQAIQYPSTQGLGHLNFAFWGNIREYLDFVGFRVARIDSRNGTQSRIDILADSFWNDQLSKFEYFSPYSEQSKKKFEDPLLNILIQK